MDSEEVDDYEQSARLLSIQDPRSGAFLKVLPKQNMNVFTTEDFQVAVQLRLGLELTIIRKDLICNCAQKVKIDGMGYHIGVC